MDVPIAPGISVNLVSQQICVLLWESVEVVASDHTADGKHVCHCFGRPS